MKRNLLVLALAAAVSFFGSCSSTFDDSEIWDAIEELKAQITSFVTVIQGEDGEYYWAVCKDGKPVALEVDGKKVPVTVTPSFQISKDNTWMGSLDGGASFLFGDNPFNFSIMKSNFNIGGGYNFHNFYRLYVKAGKGEYTGQGKDNEFVVTDADYINASINLSADLIGLIFGYDEARKVTLYPHIGIGQTQYRVTTDVSGEGTQQVGYNRKES